MAREGKHMKDLPITRLVPNVLTLMSLCAGLTGMRMALLGRWEEAVISIVVASVFDILDGRVARMLNIASKFGAELDSLSDLISFGVAPAFILYQWVLHDGGSFGWIGVLAYSVCCALRLARFNTMLEDEAAPAWAKKFFTGMPSPAGAGLALLPLLLSLEFGDDFRPRAALLALWLIVLGGMMVSRMPTFSLKGRRVGRVWVAPILVIVGLATASLVTNPWLTLSVLAIIYIIMIPVGWISYHRQLSREGNPNV